ncbi:hypothetical protein CapIbe_021731 [Capra ibex]
MKADKLKKGKKQLRSTGEVAPCTGRDRWAGREAVCPRSANLENCSPDRFVNNASTDIVTLHKTCRALRQPLRHGTGGTARYERESSRPRD